MELIPYLNFNGNCAEAFRFYEQLLGGKIQMISTFGEGPAKEHVPGNWHDKIMHAHLVVDGEAVFGCDAPPGTYSTPRGLHVAIGVKTAAEAERIFTALADRGTITMPFEQTFWSAGFGMVVDRFGTPWMINAEPVA